MKKQWQITKSTHHRLKASRRQSYRSGPALKIVGLFNWWNAQHI